MKADVANDAIIVRRRNWFDCPLLGEQQSQFVRVCQGR
jgi:hypothetical protein